MVESIIKKPVSVRQTKINIGIKQAKQNKECRDLLAELESSGWKIARNIDNDVICIELTKPQVSPSDVKIFDRLAKYIENNSSTEFKPEPYQTATPSVWWFFEYGKMRESHWGATL